MGRDANSRRRGCDIKRGLVARQILATRTGGAPDGQDVRRMTFGCDTRVRATTRAATGGAARSGSSVTPKCERATADEWTTTVATISVKVVIANPGSEAIPSSDVIRQGWAQGDGAAREFCVMLQAGDPAVTGVQVERRQRFST
jgi:hypothetical protein